MSFRAKVSLKFQIYLCLSATILSLGFTNIAAASPTLVQHANRDAGTTTSSTLSFATSNTAGNWIAVCVRAGHSGEVFTVRDSRGNTYKSAALINDSVDAPNGETLAIFYAENVSGGANTVSLSDTISATMRFAIFEYAGVASSNSLDVSVGTQGTSSSPGSGNATTSFGNDLVLGLVSTADPANFTPGSGYIAEERVPAEPNTKLLIEDRIQAAAGAVSATASLASSDPWGAIVAAFKPGSGASSAPSITSVSPNSGTVGTSVTISGSNFGSSQGTSTVKFNGTSATPTSWGPSSVVVPVPSGATTGNIVVTVGGVSSNGVSFTITSAPPNISSLSPNSGAMGTSVTISGANFGSSQGTSTVKFNGMAATPKSWSSSSIVAPVPSGATSGNVVVIVSGVSSNGMSFTVTGDSTPPTVSITAPTSGATVSGTTTVTANASDNTGVSSVQFQLDGANLGAPDTASPYSTSWDTTTTANGSHTLTAIAKDAAGNSTTSAAVSVTVSNSAAGGMGPLKQSTVNSHYFVAPSGKAVLLAGSQTWNSFMDLADSASPVALDFTAYVNFLKSHGHNVTILWRKDLPTACGWGADGGNTTWNQTPFPWMRTGGSSGTQVASDGLPAFDLNKFNQAYFDRLRARVQQLQQNGIYAIVQLFDGFSLVQYRCSNDGYPFHNGNNVNGIDDGGGTGSMTMTSTNAVTNIQDAYVRKVIDTINDLPNVLWEPSEEAPDNSTWWQAHMISLIRSYEAGKPLQHPVGFASLDTSGSSDSTLYNSNADWVAPHSRISPTSSCGSGTPQCKVNINDSDHSYGGMWNDSAQTNRNYLWENFTNGNTIMFMDPYVIYWPSGNRNLCSSPMHGVCSAPDSRWNNFRDNMGYMLTYANTKLDLLKMTPQGNLSSTGYCLADNVASGAEFLVYAPSGGSFTLNLSATTRTLKVEWLNPSSGAIINGGSINGGSSSQSFTPPFSGDAVLYLVDALGHN